jgi:hypothetical protein
MPLRHAVFVDVIRVVESLSLPYFLPGHARSQLAEMQRETRSACGADLTSLTSNRTKMYQCMIDVDEMVAASRSVNSLTFLRVAEQPQPFGQFESADCSCLRLSAVLQSRARGGGGKETMHAEYGLLAMARSLQMTQIDTILE